MSATADFTRQYFCLAKEVERRYGVPYLVCLGQASVESDNGKAAPSFNFFGIKAFSNWKGKTQVFTTTDYINGQYVVHKQTFRAYDSPTEGFMDYGNYLRNSGLYNSAFQYTNPYEFIKIIGHIYATDFYAGIVSGRMKTIQNIITNENLSCNQTGKIVGGILFGAVLATGIAYKFDIESVKNDLKKL